MKTKTKVAIAAATVVLTFAGSAQAGGFLADVFVRPFSPQLATDLDKLHEKAGKPLDTVAREAVRAYIGGRMFM